jgi:hypothetical protein
MISAIWPCKLVLKSALLIAQSGQFSLFRRGPLLRPALRCKFPLLRKLLDVKRHLMEMALQLGAARGGKRVPNSPAHADYYRDTQDAEDDRCHATPRPNLSRDYRRFAFNWALSSRVRREREPTFCALDFLAVGLVRCLQMLTAFRTRDVHWFALRRLATTPSIRDLI